MRVYLECKAFKQRFGVVKARVNEGINQVTLIDLELAAKEELTQPDLEELIGKPITLFVDDHINGQLHVKRWDGIIFELIDVVNGKDDNGIFYYTMVIRPALWKLNYFVHSRSYTEKSRVEVIDELLKEHGIQEKENYTKSYKSEKVYPTFRQLLQTGTTDLTFFHNTLTNAGINYYFSCDPNGEKPEVMNLVDDNVFFPKYEETIPIVKSGLQQKDRRVEIITRHTRAIPGAVSSTAFLADGATKPKVKEVSQDGSGVDGQVKIYVPEGGTDAEGAAAQAGRILSEGFSANRIIHRGIADHIQITPGKRITFKDFGTAKEYSLVIVSAHHTFEQAVQASLSEKGSGDPSYKNHFTAVEPNSNVRPQDNTDVDIDFTLDGGLDLDLNGRVSINPKFKFSPEFNFNPTFSPQINVKGIGVLLGAVAALQAQIKALNAKIRALGARAGTDSGGLVAAIVTEDAQISNGKELVCQVTSHEFEQPITAKVSLAWHSPQGGSHILPRAGNSVWVQRIHGARGNDWVVVGYRPEGDTPTMDPAKTTETKRLKSGSPPELGSAPEAVVEHETFGPSNRQRNAICGEGAVAEVAVIDGSDASVVIRANNAAYIVAGEQLHLSAKTQCHYAESLFQQFGQVARGVIGDQKESIGANHEMTVMEDQKVHVEGNIEKTVTKDVSIEIAGSKSTAVHGDVEENIGGKETKQVGGNRKVVLESNHTEEISGKETKKIGGSRKLSISGSAKTKVGGNESKKVTGNSELKALNVKITANGELKATAKKKLELVCGKGSLEIDAAGNVKINGIMVDVTGKAPVTITGPLVKLNA